MPFTTAGALFFAGIGLIVGSLILVQLERSQVEKATRLAEDTARQALTQAVDLASQAADVELETRRMRVSEAERKAYDDVLDPHRTEVRRAFAEGRGGEEALKNPPEPDSNATSELRDYVGSAKGAASAERHALACKQLLTGTEVNWTEATKEARLCVVHCRDAGGKYRRSESLVDEAGAALALKRELSARFTDPWAPRKTAGVVVGLVIVLALLGLGPWLLHENLLGGARARAARDAIDSLGRCAREVRRAY